MKIACVDDNQEILQQMGALLNRYGEEKGIMIDLCCYDSAEEFLKETHQGEYNIVFMDIYFDGQEMTGIEAARKLRRKDSQCMIIFLTSSSDHMPEAFAVHAFSYVLKEELENQMRDVLDDAVKVLPVAKNLSVKQGSQELKIPHQTIICAYTDGHYMNIRILQGEPVRLRMTFRELLDQLETEKCFLQINKGVLVNMDHIKSIEEGDCGMIDGTWLPIRHRDRSSLIATWRSYQFDKIREEQS